MKHLKTFEGFNEGRTIPMPSRGDETDKSITKDNCKNCGAAHAVGKLACPWCKSAYKESTPSKNESDVKRRKVDDAINSRDGGINWGENHG